MADNLELKACPWCEGETKSFDVGLSDGSIVVMVIHNGWPHCCATRAQMTLAQWNHRVEARTPTPPAGEVVERVARALCEVDGKTWRDRSEKPALGMSHDYDFDKLNNHWRHLATAALAAGSGERWLPIESAPKEEFTQVILIARNAGQAAVMPALFDGDRWQSISLVGLIPFVSPTHWQPLPAPPALNEQEG